MAPIIDITFAENGNVFVFVIKISVFVSERERAYTHTPR